MCQTGWLCCAPAVVITLIAFSCKWIRKAFLRLLHSAALNVSVQQVLMKPVILVLLSCIVLLMWMKLQCPTLPVGMKGAIENHLANIGTEINPAASHNAVLWKGTTVLTNWEQCTGWRMFALLHLAHTPVPDWQCGEVKPQTIHHPIQPSIFFSLSLELHDLF